MAIRVYVPLTRDGLAHALAEGRIASPFRAHAVTDALVDAWPEGDEEELAYAAMAAAAYSSWELRTSADAPRRYVLAVDAESVATVASDDPTEVEVRADLSWQAVASAHVDLEDVREANLDDADLAWHATQEIPSLVS